MATQTEVPPLGGHVRMLLAQLRRRIRIYVCLEGLLLALFWLGLTFWIGLAIDYLPVLVGASEMPRPARAVMLAIIAVILAYVLYRWVLRRTFARLPDHSMAVLLERRFNSFHDGLVTVVELAEQPDHAAGFNPYMLSLTAAEIESQTDGVQVGKVFRWTPLVSKAVAALLLIIPIGIFIAVNAPAAEIWFNRLYLLKDQPWPRSAHVEVTGIQVQRTNPVDGSVTLGPLVPFPADRKINVAKGSSVLVHVRTDATKVVPEYCTLSYRTDENQTGRVTMPKRGRIRNGYQPYVYDGKPFRGILSSITFGVRACDHRVEGYHLHVVPSPAIIDAQLDCTFPKYMVDRDLSLWLPRTVPLTGGTQLPNGTHIVIRARVNKSLVRAEVRDVKTGKLTKIDIANNGGDPHEIQYTVPKLNGQVMLEWTLFDTDGVANDPPYTMTIEGIEDQSPRVNVALDGIGTAVTPNVVIPVKGKIEDDYDVGRAWFELTLNNSTPRKFPFSLPKSGKVDARLDFRKLRGAGNGALTLKPKDKLNLVIKAADKCDLGPEPNVGSGDHYQLDVVTPDELLAQLERRELGLRRRFEQIIDEMNQMRDSLDRIRNRGSNPLAVAPEDVREPHSQPTNPGGAVPPTGDKSADQAEQQRDRALRLLYAQRAVMQSKKSAQEILGVAASFDDIRRELINNRVDTEDRKIRLKDQIADPLRLVGQTMFPELDRRLELLEQKLNQGQAGDQTASAAVQQTDDILVELDKVLQKMLELETYNELINIVRSLLEEQKQITEQTKKQRVKQVRDLLK